MKSIPYFDVEDFPIGLQNDVTFYFLGELSGTIYTVGEFAALDEYLYTEGLHNGQLVAIKL